MITILIISVAALAILAATLWVERSPRRAALATLRVATAETRAYAATGANVDRRPAPERSRQESPGAHQAQVRLNQIVSLIARPARRLCPAGYLANTRRRLTLAGRDRQSDADRFFALRLVTLALVGPVFLVILLLPLPGLFSLLAFALFVSLLGLGPEAFLNREVSDRQERIRHHLPTMVELLMISVEAGLGFDQALARAVLTVPGPLSEEFSRFLGEVRIGADHKEALEAIDRRTDVDELRSFLMALVQASTFGVSVGPILRSQAESIRVAQRQYVQEKAQKAPVKMLFPLVFCVLPVLFIVVIGPAAIQIDHTLLHLK